MIPMFTCRIDPSLELRLWEEHHADELFAVVEANRQYLKRWMTWVDKTNSADDSRAFIRRALEQFARHEGFHAGIWLDGKIVGGIGLVYVSWINRKTEIGYWLAENAQGKGIMTRACRAVIGHLFGELKLNRIEIRCAAGNERSRAVPRRLGFTQEAILRQGHLLDGKYHDDVVYGLLAEEWLTSSK